MRLLTGLRAFHYTARCGSTTAAAAEMGVSQPTVSAQIGALEKQFGVQLFLQIGRKLMTTEFADSLLVITNRLFALEEEAHSMLMEAEGMLRGHLRIGAVGPYNVMPVLAAFQKRHPRIYVSLSVGDSSQIVDRILNYHADLGVLVHDVQDERVESVAYRRQPLVVFAHREHPLARRESLSVHDLHGCEFVGRESGSTTQRVFNQALERAGVRVKQIMEIGSRESIREAVANGIGLGVVSEVAYVDDHRLVPLPIDDLDAATYSHVICLRERMKSRLVMSFLELVHQLRAELEATDRRLPSAELAVRPLAGRAPIEGLGLGTNP
ncbi:LysR substrate-binding domain-containing protein [Hydrocarboniphaga effusa]|uniref:LysR substrate-binding domain-containing protein n=1 Tax=Hydrocarboniphaga effusa TaxID=243629 RepID=UPI003137DB36